jgi:hypothetical protein
LPKPLIDWVGPLSYPALQGMFDALNPLGMQWYWKGDFVDTLPDAAIDVHLAHAAKLPSTFSLMHLYPIDGAVHRTTSDATASGARDAMWSMGYRWHRPEPGESSRAEGMGNRLLGRGASVRPRRRLFQLYDGRRGRGAGSEPATATIIRASRL